MVEHSCHRALELSSSPHAHPLCMGFVCTYVQDACCGHIAGPPDASGHCICMLIPASGSSTAMRLQPISGMRCIASGRLRDERT